MVLPCRLDGCRLYTRNFLIKDLGVRTVLPWCPDRCKLSPHSVSIEESWNLLEL
jgi:hypothetical protein